MYYTNQKYNSDVNIEICIENEDNSYFLYVHYDYLEVVHFSLEPIFTRGKKYFKFNPNIDLQYCPRLLEAVLKFNAGSKYQCFLHRFIYVLKNQKVIKSNQVIHHMDFNAENNHPDNLIAMDKKEHDLLHKIKREKDIKIFQELNGFNLNKESKTKRYRTAKISKETKNKVIMALQNHMTYREIQKKYNVSQKYISKVKKEFAESSEELVLKPLKVSKRKKENNINEVKSVDNQSIQAWSQKDKKVLKSSIDKGLYNVYKIINNILINLYQVCKHMSKEWVYPQQKSPKYALYLLGVP